VNAVKLLILSAMLVGALSIPASAQTASEPQDPGAPAAGATRPLPSARAAQSATSTPDDDDSSRPGQLPGSIPGDPNQPLSANPPASTGFGPLSDPGAGQQLSRGRQVTRCYDGEKEVSCER